MPCFVIVVGVFLETGNCCEKQTIEKQKQYRKIKRFFIFILDISVCKIFKYNKKRHYILHAFYLTLTPFKTKEIVIFVHH